MIALVLVAAASVLGPRQTVCTTERLATLPLVERPATPDTGKTLVILMTGDGNWASPDERVAAKLRAQGGSVIGLSMSAYLKQRRAPAEVAADVECIARTYLARWHRTQILFLGYSRGADLAPFVLSRWPDDLTSRINMVGLIALGRRANFQYHLIDLIRDVERPDDVLTLPELAKLRALRVVCIYGAEEDDSACRDPSLAWTTRVVHAGGHRLTKGFETVDSAVVAGLTKR